MVDQNRYQKIQNLVRLKMAFARIISYVTLAPLMAFVTMTILHFVDKNHFHSQLHYLLAVLYLAAVPLLAYPFYKILPAYRDRGREGQRDFSFVMVMIGYTLGLLNALFLHAPAPYLMIYVGYFLSGLLLTLTNKFLKIKASGHACGIMGPIVLFIFFFGQYSYFLLLLLPVVFWSRLKLHRHSFFELLSGASVSFICTVLSIVLVSHHIGI